MSEQQQQKDGMKMRTARESVGWLNTEGPLTTSPDFKQRQLEGCLHSNWSGQGECPHCRLSRLEAENARLRELEGDAVTLRGYIARYGETPMMTHSRAEAAESKLSALIASVREIVSQRHSDEPCEDCGQCVLCRYHSLVSALQQAIGDTQ